MATWKENYDQVLNKHIGKLHYTEEVTQFIFNFTNRDETIEDFFLNGRCYWFAEMLKKRFADRLPKIWYDSLDNHFLVEIHSILYDAQGIWAPINNSLTEKRFNDFYIWEDYKKFDPIHAKRITKQCITFEEGN